jgi:hypothetical protein
VTPATVPARRHGGPEAPGGLVEDAADAILELFLRSTHLPLCGDG